MLFGIGIKFDISLVFATRYKNVFAFKSSQTYHMIVSRRYSKKNSSADQLLCAGCGKSNAIFVFLKYKILYL